jgi:hypothetical protein
MSEGVGGMLTMRCMARGQLRGPVGIINLLPDVASFIDSALARRGFRSPARPVGGSWVQGFCRGRHLR